MTGEQFQDAYGEMVGDGSWCIRIVAARLHLSEHWCELDVVHRVDELVIRIGWRPGEIDAWDTADSQLQARWPQLFPGHRIAHPFGPALTQVVIALRDGRGPTLPVDMTEQEAIQIIHGRMRPDELHHVEPMSGA